MADQDWRTMEAGRELDRIIAESDGYETRATEGHRPEIGPDFWAIRDGNMHALPHYSTDGNEALRLLERLYKGDERRPNEVYLQPGLGGWYIRINSVFTVVMQDTPALAICRAWLMWKNHRHD